MLNSKQIFNETQFRALKSSLSKVYAPNRVLTRSVCIINMMEKSRIEWVDTAKTVAIILVVMGHMGFPTEVKTIIYSFHMPLFFMLSGFFISVKCSFKEFVARKTKSLLIPYIWFNIFFILFDYCIASISNSEISIVNSLIGTVCGLRIGYDCVGRFWFLPCLFIAEVLLFVLLKTSKLYKTVFGIFVLLLLGFLFNYLDYKSLPYSFDMAVIALFFVGFGKLFIKKMNFTPPYGCIFMQHF